MKNETTPNPDANPSASPSPSTSNHTLPDTTASGAGFNLFTSWFTKAMAAPGATFKSVAAAAILRQNPEFEAVLHIGRCHARVTYLWKLKYHPAALPPRPIVKARIALTKLFNRWMDQAPSNLAVVDEFTQQGIELEHRRLRRERTEYELELNRRKALWVRRQMDLADRRYELQRQKLALKHKIGPQG
jgi:hypothetical protein